MTTKKMVIFLIAVVMMVVAATYIYAESTIISQQISTDGNSGNNASCNHVTDDAYHYMGESHSNSDYTQHYWWESIYCFKCGYVFSTKHHSTNCTSQQCNYIE